MKLQSWCNMIHISLSWYQIPEFLFRFMISLIYEYVPFVVTKSRHFLFRDSSSNMTFHMMFNTTSTAGGTGSAYPSRAYMFTHLIHFLVIFSQFMSFWVMFFVTLYGCLALFAWLILYWLYPDLRFIFTILLFSIFCTQHATYSKVSNCIFILINW
jgi:hypothetical protein